MKFNLKNFPSQEFERGSMAWYEWCKKKTEETKTWFEGFEAELRNTNNLAYTHLYKGELWVKVKEILGEL